MRHPSELFIKYLIVLDYDVDKIKQNLEEFGLPTLLEDEHADYIQDLKKDIDAKKPKSFFIGSLDESVIKFLKDIRIYSLVHPDTTITQCIALLDNAQARREIFLALLGKIPEKELVHHLSFKFKIDNLSERVIQVFSHYYFNVDILSIEDWCKLFETMQAGNDAKGYEACLTGGAIVASYRIGVEQNITIREVVKEAVTALYVSLQEIRHWPASSSKIKVLSDTVSALAKAHVVINTADQELASVAEELRQFKLARNTNKPISLVALAGPNHSHSGKIHD
jgi:hypothetical protein